MTALIDDEAGLGELCEEISGAELVGIDTEFVRERTYFAQLCLVQVAAGEQVAGVDCLAGLDLEPLFAALTRPGLTWVLHSGRQDLEVIARRAQALPAAVIDTQIAGALLGYPTQAGLREILAEVLDVDVGKGYTRTDWSRRPLPEGAVRYALDDVRYLLPLWRALERRLADAGRLDWLAEDSERLMKEAERSDLLAIWSRLKGVRHLDPDRQAATLALVRWRERTARALDRPRRWILSDELLARIAHARPQSAADVAAVAEIPGRLAARYGEEIVASLQARHDAELAAELERAAQPHKPDKDALKTLQQRLRERALELGINADVLASRRDLAALLAGAAPEHLRSGWRKPEIERLAEGLRSS